MSKDYSVEFQTPPEVCRYMASLVPGTAVNVLEPTKGIGNIVEALTGFNVISPDDYFLLDKSLKFDAVVMNPPFSSKSAVLDNAPPIYANYKGMKFGYRLLTDCMQKSDVVIALMPWFTISDSDVRLRFLKSFGMKSLTALPRKTFEYARIQTCVMELVKGYQGVTEFKVFDFIDPIPSFKHRLQNKLELDVEVKQNKKNLMLF